MIVKDVMTADVVSVDKDRNLMDVLELMKQHNITKIPVTEDDALVGIVTDGMIADKLGRMHNKGIQTSTLHASSVMSKDFVSAHPDESLANLMSSVGKPGLTMIPVVRGTQLVGVVTKADLLRLVDSEAPIENIMQTQLQAVSPSERLVHARRLILDNDIARLPVLDNGSIVGMIAEHEIAGAFASFKQADISVQKATIRDLQVGSYMKQPVVVGNTAMSAREAAAMMLQNNVGALPLVNGGTTIQGIVTRTDLIRTYAT